jgi:hypothetical protein
MRWLRLAGVVAACLALAVPSSAVAQGDASCQPPCRRGFFCQEGRCILGCNPPCPAGHACIDNHCVDAPAPHMTPTPPPPPPEQPCDPPCRDGFKCVGGACRSLCNPECEPGSVCRGGECFAKLGQSSTPGTPAAPAAPIEVDGVSPYGDERSGALAFILELFLGLGIGNYYAGSVGWGLMGTLGTLSFYTGAGLIGWANACDADPNCDTSTGTLKNVGLGLLIGGAVFRLVTIITAPVMAASHNRKLREARARLYRQPQSWQLTPSETWRWRAEERPRGASLSFASTPQPIGVAVPVLRW